MKNEPQGHRRHSGRTKDREKTEKHSVSRRDAEGAESLLMKLIALCPDKDIVTSEKTLCVLCVSA
jgi:hypothetical protein